MSAFDLDAELSGDAAFRLVAPSYVRLFWRTSVLDTVVATLREQGYQVVRLDASTWPSEADLHRDIAAALHFPDYYGHNLNALNDCLSDVVTYDYGTTPDATGLVLVFIGYDTFSRRCPWTAQVGHGGGPSVTAAGRGLPGPQIVGTVAALASKAKIPV